VHERTAELVYRAAVRVRNPSLWKEYERLKKSEFLSLAELRQIQLDRTQRLLESAEKYSALYREHFRTHGFSARRFSSLEDLTRLPVMTKNDLVAENERIQSSFDFGRLLTAETSGTSGVALEFRRSEQWDSINRAHVLRAYDWYGVPPWARNGYLWGYDIAPARARKVRILDSLQNRFRLFRYDRESIAEFARKLHSAVFLSGYSSMIYEVAKAMNERALEAPGLRMVKGTSEMILDVYQAEAVKAFGRKIVSEYGAAESGLIAFECPSGSMHINIEDVVLETAEDGAAIVTNLASHSFPIIRYQLGDVVALGDASCSCGRAHPVLKEVVGRRGGSVVGIKGRYPALTFYYVFKNIAINSGILLNYRVVQDEPRQCVITIENLQSAKHEHLVREQLTKYFADDVDFEIRYASELPRGGKKAQYFESRL
jgi:phenylacetate-CoA ligase